MLPGPFRLKRQKDFHRVYKRGSSRAYPAFVLHRRPTGTKSSPAPATTPVVAKAALVAEVAPATSPRFGFSVSKKLGNAVIRNRVKRRLRHAVYELRDSFPAGMDYVFVARTAAAHTDHAQLMQQVRRAAQDARSAAGKPYGAPSKK